MARAELEHVVQDEDGNALGGAQVAIYELDGVTPLAQTIYSASEGGTANPGGHVLTTNTAGFTKGYVENGQRAIAKRGGVSYPVTFWPDPETIPNSEHAAINVKDAPYNTVGDGITDDTAGIQAALNDSYDVVNGYRSVFIPRGHYAVSNLLIYAGTKIRGEGMGVSFIEALPGATGVGIRERNPTTEGNIGGAQFIQLEMLTIDGMGRWTNCVNLGNAGGHAWSTQSGVDHLLVTKATAAAFEANCNVVALQHLWCLSSATGLYVYGSNVHAFALNVENCTAYNIRCQAQWSTFHGTQSEGGGAAVALRLEQAGSGSSFYGLFHGLGSNQTADFIQVADACNDVALYDMRLYKAGFTLSGFYFNRTSAAWGAEHLTDAEVDHGALTYVMGEGGFYTRSGRLTSDKLWVGAGYQSVAAGDIGLSGGVYPGSVSVFPYRRYDPTIPYTGPGGASGTRAHPTANNPGGGHVEVVDSNSGASALYRVEGGAAPVLVSGHVNYAAGTAAAASKFTLWWDAGTSTLRCTNNINSNGVMRFFWRSV